MRLHKIIPATILVLSLSIAVSCSKKDDDHNKPSEKKKYAWVTGAKDSTGYGLMLFTPDGGKTWERIADSSEALKNMDLSDIWAVSETKIWACGGNNSIVGSKDGGKTWSAFHPENPTNPDLSMISIYGDNLWICGDSGTVYQSKDAGQTWKLHNRDFFYNARLQGIGAVNEHLIYAVGQYTGSNRGFIAFTKDGGEHWDTIAPADNYNQWQWIGVASYKNTIVIYGAKAHYMLSTDGGTTWKNDSVAGASGGGGKADLNDLIMLDGETWWGAFDMGNIFITRNSGKTWTKQSVPVSAGGSFLVGIDCWNREEAIVVGAGFYFPPVSPVLTTDDGGDSDWNQAYMANVPLWKVSVIREE